MTTTTQDAVREAFDKLESEAAPTEGTADGTSAAAAVDSGDSSPLPEAGETASTQAPEDAPSPGESPDGKVRDGKGRFAQKVAPTQKGLDLQTPNSTKPPAAAVPEVTAPPVAGVPVATLKAPQSWKPAERETWAKLPPEAQRAVDRREREMQAGFEDAAEAKRQWGAFREAVAPYEGMLRGEGMDPIREVGNLLQVAQAMRTAPPQHKAQIIANMVKSFNIPIDVLDSVLAGDGPPQGQPGPAMDPRAMMAQVKQELMADMQRQRQQGQSQRSAQDIATFGAKSEFFEDVRNDMGDLMAGAAARGVALTLDEAYNRACRADPKIWEILQQREAAKNVANAQASTQRAKAASTSIKSQPAAQMNGVQAKTTRDAVEQAWEQLSRP